MKASSRKRMLPKAVAVAMAVALCALVVIMLGAPGSLSRAVAATGTLGSRYGAVDSHFKLHNGSTMDRELSDLAAAGVKSLRFDFAWADLEPARDAWNFAQADLAVAKAQSYGIQVLGILGACPTWANGNRPFNYPPTDIEAWKNYVSNVCTRYKGQVTAWEIWNEENIHGFWLPSPDANAYVALVKQTTPQIRAADPAATVVMGGVAGLDPNYLDNCFKAGVADYVDAVAYHPYPEALTFMNYTPQESNCRYIVSWLRWLISTYTTKPIQIWLTEFGWTSCTGTPPGVSEATQAAYLLRSMVSYGGCQVDRVYWYNAWDGAQNPADSESNYGLLANDFTKKPAYSYYKTFLNVFGQATSEVTGVTSVTCSAPGSLEAHSFALQDGGMAMAVWKADDLADTATVTVNNATYGDPAKVDPLTGVAQAAAGVTRDPHKITIAGVALGKEPVIFRLPESLGGVGAPKIVSLAPASGPVGMEVTLSGSSFGATRGTSYVSFGTVQAIAYTLWSDTSVKCNVPAGASGAVQVTVTTPAGTSIGATFTAPLSPPNVTAITPNEGAEKTAVSITNLAGTGFQAGATVTLSNSSASAAANSVQVVSATRITCTVNVPAGVYDVTVKNPEGQQAKLVDAFFAAPPCGSGSGGVAAISLAALLPVTSLRFRKRLRRKTRVA